MTDALHRLGRHLGVMPRYQDQTERWHDTADATMAAIVSAMGYDAGDAAGELARLKAEAAARVLPLWQVVPAQQSGPEVTEPWHLTLESGGESSGRGALPVLPLGIHRLEVAGQATWLLAAPETLPAPPKSWGVTLPLYGLRTAAEGGLGSYRDLRDALAGLAAAGAGFVGVNPIHAGFPHDPSAFSPYAPTSRRRFSSLHIDSGARHGGTDTLIDYARAVPAQMQALRAAHADFPGDPAFEAFLAEGGEDLRRFALHQALCDVHGPYWPDWPTALHDFAAPEVAAFAAAHPAALRFHAWCQWRAETQLAAVRDAADGMALGLYLDLAVGTHPDGAETWGHPALFAPGCSLGAPPDGFSADGQRWNLAPMRPHVLAEGGFHALAQILRAQLRFARVLRIDHILGFERAFWVPEDAPGAYVSMPKAALLAVARIEAARAGAVIVGEDLGNIPKGLHADLEASGILGCRVAMFEQDWQSATPAFKPAAAYDRRVLTAFASHDLPTWRGWRRGTDIAWRARLGSLDCAAQSAAMARRAAEVAAFEAAIGGRNIGRLNGFLAATPSWLVALQAEDLLGLIEQPNLPGTVYDHPNWRRRLGVSAADLARHPGVVQAARIMKTAGR